MGSGTRFALEFFGSTLYFFGLLTTASLTESCSFWYGLKYLLPMMKSKSIKGTCIHTVVYGAVRGRMG